MIVPAGAASGAGSLYNWRCFAARASLDMMTTTVMLLTAASALADAGGSAFTTGGCSVADFGAVADNKTDGTKAFRAAAKSGCAEILVPPGVWMT